MSETTIFISEDSQTYVLGPTRDRYVMSEAGTGMVPLKYITNRALFQPGESIERMDVEPRVVELDILHKFCDRQAFWTGRNTFLDAIRPNRGFRGTLRKVLADGRKRDLTVVVADGPKWQHENPNEWRRVSWREMVRFIAHDPIYYDPTQKTLSLLHPCVGVASGFPYTFTFPFTVAICELEFEATFEIEFTGFTEIAGNIDYPGTWESYPVVTVTGPGSTRMELVSTTTGKQLILEGFPNLGVGETIVLDLTFGVKSITGPGGANYLQYLTSDSDLVDFSIQPGINSFTGTLQAAAATSSIVLAYYERYIGI